MRRLKHKYLCYKQRVQSLSILDSIAKRKSAQLQQIALFAVTYKTKTKLILLNNLSRIVVNLNKNKVSVALIKIQGCAKPKIEKNSAKKKIASNSPLELTAK